jgi:SAM-dependent methyltransferase
LFAQPGVALEVGVGDGLMLNALRSLGWRVIGNERTAEMASFAHRHLGLPVFAGDIDALQPAPHFDLIILFQVLEHIDDPLKMLKQLRTLLKPDGKLIIGVPNFESWQSSFGKSNWFHLDVPRHLFHYSPASLANCLSRADMEIEQVSHVSLEHDPYGWLQTILNRFDRQPNRLTRLLMRMDALDANGLANFVAVPLLGIASVELSALSWLFHRGALIEVIARPTKN